MGNQSFNIERVVFDVCKEAEAIVPKCVRSFTESELFAELVLCMLSSQELYEVALDYTKQLVQQGVLAIPKTVVDLKKKKNLIDAIFQKPALISVNGRTIERKLRFANKKANYVLLALEQIYFKGTSLTEIVYSCDCKYEARTNIVQTVPGIGLKQASMFLRNIGYYNEYAILDKHILDYMCLVGLINQRIASIPNSSQYLVAEQKLKQYATAKKTSLLHLDMAIWTTMRVFKKLSA